MLQVGYCVKFELLLFFFFFSQCYKLVGVVDTEKKSGDMNIDKVASPPLSERLREITNNLRLLESSTSLHMLMPKQLDTSQGSLESSGDIIEPKTPKAETDMRTGDKLEIAMYTSPWERFHMRSSGAKV